MTIITILFVVTAIIIISVIKYSFDKIAASNSKEFQLNRDEASKNARLAREELSKTLESSTSLSLGRLDKIEKNIEEKLLYMISKSNENATEIRKELNEALKEFAKGNEQELEKIESKIDEKMHSLLTKVNEDAKANREELKTALKSFEKEFVNSIKIFREEQTGAFGALNKQQEDLIEKAESKLEKISKTIEQKLKANQDTFTSISKINRDDLTKSLKSFEDAFGKRVKEFNDLQKQKFDSLISKQGELVKSTEQKLEKMRETVDEKLHATLEKRLGDSFKIVSERLELVHKGLGEMQALATGVGDLKKVLTNVKTMGTWGEIQLGNLLEQILSPDQYGKNIATKRGSNETVEYAVKLPGKDETVVWIPVDAKFPKEIYEKLQKAQDDADADLVEDLEKALETRIKIDAKNIRDKYIDPPNTTDFAILFLPTEGLYAEVLRRPGLGECLQREFRVAITGPTTISALLNSLQLGFRSLVIEKRASEVWNLLGAVKTEFGRFGDMLDKTHKQLQAASNTIEGAAKRSRSIERKLRDVQELPQNDSIKLLPDISPDIDEEKEDQL